MMLSAQAAPAGPAGIALLGVRNRLHFTLTALANWHQPFRGRPLGEVKTQLSSYFFLLLFFFRSMSLPFVFRGVSNIDDDRTVPVERTSYIIHVHVCICSRRTAIDRPRDLDSRGSSDLM